jgi:DNA-binding PadR family transcriptional regulator
VNNQKYLKGLIEPIILKLLQEEGRMYGYEITQKIKLLTQDKVVLTEGALYPMLHKLEADGLLDTTIEMHNNRQRKYYQLTHKGKAQSKAVLESLQAFWQTLGLLVQPKPQIA